MKAIVVGSNEVLLQRVLSDEESAVATQQLLHPSPVLRQSCWHLADDLTTIGAPLYRNRDRPQVYADLARTTNRLLYDTYRWLYDRVADVFEHRYSAPVSFVDELAIPGFHLMQYDRAGTSGGGGWHVDQLPNQVRYFADRLDELRGVLNFTLPLAVPDGGTGMDIIANSNDLTHVGYEPGVMLFTECELMHRIGASVCLTDNGHRLTMQGHGVLFRGRLLLFW